MPKHPRHDHDLDAIGRRLAAERERAGLSQRQLAFDGCTAAYISRLEAGARQASDMVLTALAERLGTTLRFLKTGHHDPVELGLADATLTLGDLTDDERQTLDYELEQAAFKAARSVAWQIRKARSDVKLADLETERRELEEATA